MCIIVMYFLRYIFLLYFFELLRKIICSIGVLFLDKCYLVLCVIKGMYIYICI